MLNKMPTVFLQANVCINMVTSEMVSASLVVDAHTSYCRVGQIKSLMILYVDYNEVYYDLQSSSSDKEPNDTVCRSQCGVLWFTVK